MTMTCWVPLGCSHRRWVFGMCPGPSHSLMANGEAEARTTEQVSHVSYIRAKPRQPLALSPAPRPMEVFLWGSAMRPWLGTLPVASV